MIRAVPSFHGEAFEITITTRKWDVFVLFPFQVIAIFFFAIIVSFEKYFPVLGYFCKKSFHVANLAKFIYMLKIKQLYMLLLNSCKMLHYASNVAKLFAKKYEYAIIIVYLQEAQ